MLRAGEISSVTLTQYLLDRIDTLNPRLIAFRTIFADESLQSAARLDQALKSGHDRGLLHGIPMAIKDI